MSKQGDDVERAQASFLHMVRDEGDINKIQLLVEGGFISDETLTEALFCLVDGGNTANNNKIAILSILLDAGADVNAKDIDKLTPLEIAHSRGDADVTHLIDQYSPVVTSWWEPKVEKPKVKYCKYGEFSSGVSYYPPADGAQDTQPLGNTDEEA